MKLISFKINGWKSIKNDVEIDLISTLRKTKSNNELYKNNVLECDKIKVFNKIAITGSNAFGKTTLIEWFNILLFYIRDVKSFDYKDNLYSQIKKYINEDTKIITAQIKFIKSNYIYSYELHLDFKQNIFEDKLIKYKKNSKIQILNSIQSKDFKELNHRLLLNFPSKITSNDLNNSAKNEVLNKFSDYEYEEFIKILNSITGQYLDFYNSNWENKINAPIGVNKLEYVLFSNNEQIYDLFINNKVIWKEIESFINIIDKNLYRVDVMKKDDGNLDFYYIDKFENRHYFREFASTGTISAMSLILWIYINRNKLLFIDELDTSLNVLMIKELFKISYIKKTQIIFTFHNIGILLHSLSILSPKQIYVLHQTNTNKKIAKTWFELTDNNKRKYVDIERYIHNYYGGQRNV